MCSSPKVYIHGAYQLLSDNLNPLLNGVEGLGTSLHTPRGASRDAERHHGSALPCGWEIEGFEDFGVGFGGVGAKVLNSPQ